MPISDKDPQGPEYAHHHQQGIAGNLEHWQILIGAPLEPRQPLFQVRVRIQGTAVVSSSWAASARTGVVGSCRGTAVSSHTRSVPANTINKPLFA